MHLLCLQQEVGSEGHTGLDPLPYSTILLPLDCPVEKGWYLGAGSQACQKDFAAHLDSPSSVFRAWEATALAQPCQDLRRLERITPGIVPESLPQLGPAREHCWAQR